MSIVEGNLWPKILIASDCLLCIWWIKKLQADTLVNNNTNTCCSQATTKYQIWLHDNQVAGFYQQFGNITFLTVKVTTSVCVCVWLSCFKLIVRLHYSETTAVLCVSGCGSHGSSVGSRSSSPYVPVFHNKWHLLSHDGDCLTNIPALITCFDGTFLREDDFGGKGTVGAHILLIYIVHRVPAVKCGEYMERDICRWLCSATHWILN